MQNQVHVYEACPMMARALVVIHPYFILATIVLALAAAFTSANDTAGKSLIMALIGVNHGQIW